MKAPEFAERQLEAAIHIELAQGRGAPFVPTQNVERYLGIDAAADPDKLHAIWRILDVHVPRRVQIAPDLWPALPRRFRRFLPTGRYCSLFLQVKVSCYQDHWRSKYFDRFGGPYYVATISARQRRTLQRLEARVAQRAITRYIAPVFWSRLQFEQYDERREVLQNSAFLSPSVVKAHRRWMYNGPASAPLLNPEPEETTPESWELLLGLARERARSESLYEHVRHLASSLTEEELIDAERQQTTWVDRVERYMRLEEEDRQLLLNLASVTQFAEREDIYWLLLLMPDASTLRWIDMSRQRSLWSWDWIWWLLSH